MNMQRSSPSATQDPGCELAASMQHNGKEKKQETDEGREMERERWTEREIGETDVWMTTGIETEIEIQKSTRSNSKIRLALQPEERLEAQIE